MRICLLSPYHGGSHRAWARGYQRHSGHDVTLLTLPARFWKWRMHGGAVTLARKFQAESEPPDLLLATDMLDLSLFLALTRDRLGCCPIGLYMHENQLTYPLPADPATGPMRRQRGERDLHYAFINLASMLVADQIYFNSRYHRDSWFSALGPFLRGFPEMRELRAVSELREKSLVLPVGVDLKRLEPGPETGAFEAEEKKGHPLILWNHRWEFDKDPETFFSALFELDRRGVPFQLAVCGRNFSHQPTVFEEARSRLSDRLVHFGFAPESRYRELLRRADIVVSTARHEFFGIGIIEAIYLGAFPVLPARLSYPELLDDPAAEICFYRASADLVKRLLWALQQPVRRRQTAARLRQLVARFDWTVMAPRYDSTLLELSRRTGAPDPP